MLDGAEYSSASECFVSKRKKSKNKRRFSDEQIRSLEVMFESDTKLEPRKKIQLAKELGLQPRQIAIWFQNKRARWKSKQIEKDYTILLANYNNLSSQFESLKKENHSLLLQLQKLKNEMMSGKPENKNHCEIEEKAAAAAAGHSSSDDGESDYTKTKIDFEVKNIGSRGLELEGMLSVSGEDSSIKAELLVLDEENELLKMVEPAVDSCSLTSSEDWGSLDSDDLINQPTESYQWWDFWC